MKNAIAAIRNLATFEVHYFTSKDAAAQALKVFGISRTKGRELVTQTVESGTVHNCQDFTLAPPSLFDGDTLDAKKANISDLIPEGPHLDASDRDDEADETTEVHPARRKVKAPRVAPARLMSALFYRAGIAA